MLIITDEVPSGRDDFGSHIIHIPVGCSTPGRVMDESNLEASYYNKVALNWTNDDKLKAPE